MALVALFLLLFPNIVFANDGSANRLVWVVAMYVLGFLLTILILIIIAKKKGEPDSSTHESPKIKMR